MIVYMNNDGLRIHWNESATFNVEMLINEEWMEVDMFTQYDIEDSTHAKQVAAKHAYETFEEGGL